MTDSMKRRVASILVELQDTPIASSQHFLLTGWICGVAAAYGMHTQTLVNLAEPLTGRRTPPEVWTWS